ncbi:MAG TPA: maltose alpha-D-glucosyltransferase [Candidatus Saccharimonadales bacterium]|nr:maltose alpha-D-glucosyltransferase [Candidatus Saccharimonadales bacterium]
MDRVKPVKNTPWYKSAVIYEVHVRAFQDSDGDGAGDFRGLTSKLDYLRDLGVTAIWLLPFYPSPLKDDGYDIADYYRVHPSYGTLADFKMFLRQAHRRDLRVITELVINHTSDQHPWFQRARRAKPGSNWRNYYVWNDTSDKYKGTRVIFKDTEISNWTWDPLAKAYFWHRFYSHQPDLNFDHPAVHEEVFKVMDFWLDMGVDGVRLDAVPYLYEREGTSCENLAETHQFLKKLRRRVDEKYADRMLLAEANQWPDDAVAYLGEGKGDECHMAFHFPLMPRLFMSLRMEDRIPIVDILEQTPPIPETSQWALFLRNHDELTLEMVTDEERDYMYRMYANVPQARLNLGIRRRLAPLLNNDRKRIELLCALLFSLPGTPVMYYGDEIGMGENIFLGDRNGVRTPMQWSADKNAGFSRANPQSLYLPINLDPENHYEAVNVEVQERNLNSLLWWMKRLISLRKQWSAFGLGTLEFLHPDNRKILAFIRRYEEECVLVVANLSRFVQPVELDLSAWANHTPVELFGRNEFPTVTHKPYFLTLGPHAFYWFSLEAKAQPQLQSSGPVAGVEARPLISVEQDWPEVFRPRHQLPLERALRSWLPSRTWFGSARPRRVQFREMIPVPMGAETAFLAFLDVDTGQTETHTYLLPLAGARGKLAQKIARDWLPMVIARLGDDGVLYDALANKNFCRALLDLISTRRTLKGRNGELRPSHTAFLRRLRMAGGLALDPVVCKAEQSNSSIVFGERLILKCFRRLEPGVNPDLEIGQFLAVRKFPFTPSLAGALEYGGGAGEPITLGVLHAYVPKSKDAWDYTLDTLSRFYERVQALPANERKPPALPFASIAKLAAAGVPAEAVEMIGLYAPGARMLGERAAALHVALASEPDNPAFAVEPFTPHYQRGLFQSMRNVVRNTLGLLHQRLKSLPPDLAAPARKVLGLQPAILSRFRAVYERRIDAARIRYHGDFHLGQLLYTGKDFLIIDFEGPPSMAIGERRLKRSPLVDVASMIRSLHYAAHAALLQQVMHGTLQPAQLTAKSPWARFWSLSASALFYQAYRQTAGVSSFFPTNETDLNLLLDFYLLRKAMEELEHELLNRPDWVVIPLQGILELVNTDVNR